MLCTVKVKKRGSGFQGTKFRKVTRRGYEEVAEVLIFTQESVEFIQKLPQSIVGSTVMAQVTQVLSTAAPRRIADHTVSATVNPRTCPGCHPLNSG